MKELSKTQEFNYGIELLRIISMLMVVTLHVLGMGGVLGNCLPGSSQYHVAWTLEILCYCAVNCYALISGYVMFDKEFKYGKIIPLWLQVFFYSIGITVVFGIINPQQIDAIVVIKSIFPVLTKQWWYVTAYIGMYIFIPFANALIQKIEKKELLLLDGLLVLIFSALATVVSPILGDVFGIAGGYSLLWLFILYILGASVKKFEMEISNILNERCCLKKFIWLIGTFLIVFTILIHNLTVYLPDEIPGKETLQGMLVNYISPTILGFALFLLLLFSNIKIKGERLKKYIKYFGKLSFGVYLIHVHPLIFNYVLNGRFALFAELPVWQMILYIGITVLEIFIIGILIESVRQKIFQKLHIREYFKSNKNLTSHSTNSPPFKCYTTL